MRRYQHDVFRIIRVYTRDDNDAEDLAQETWIKVYRSLGKLKDPHRFPGWLKAIAVNTAKDWLKRRAHRESQATDEIEAETDGMHPRQSWRSSILEHQRQELIERIRDAIDSLSKKNREVVYDFYICGYSASEISQRLGIPVSTVDSRLNEARKQLREEFATMVAMSRIQKKFAPDTFVRNVMERVGSLPTPVPKGSVIETIGRMLPRPILPTIGIATVIALTVIGVIVVNLGNLQPSGDRNANFAVGVWQKRADMPFAKYVFSTSVVAGKIYAIGGSQNNAAGLSTIEVYNPATDRWRKIADMPTARWYFPTSAVKEKIYAFGGLVSLQPFQVIATVEEYDTGEPQSVDAKGKFPMLWGLLKVWERFTVRR